jgi:hypothetical protein
MDSKAVKEAMAIMAARPSSPHPGSDIISAEFFFNPR